MTDVPVVRAADSERDQRRTAPALRAAELPRTSTGRLRRLALPAVVGLEDGG